MERDQVAALRRVAIVLSSLPDPTARQLLASLGSDHQRAVRTAIHHLDEVDPLERRRALDGFTASIRQGRSSLACENDAAEIVLSQVALHRDGARLADRSHANEHDAMTNESSPLAFLSDVDDDAIAHRIKDEHPQTVAIVLASISARQAARLLSKLGVALRAETMRRLAKMDTPPAEVVEEIAAQLKQKLVHGAAGSGAGSCSGFHWADKSRSAGQAALQAILAEINHAAVKHDSSLGSGGMGYGDDTASDCGPWLHREAESLRRPDTLSAVTSRPAMPSPSAGSSPSARLADLKQDMGAPVGRPVKSTAEIHAQLISTPPARLREALASVDGRQAILALCGLPTATSEAVLSDLPRRQTKQIRQQIASLGMLELREIDAAKAAVAKAIRPIDHQPVASAAAAELTVSSATLAAA